MHPLIALWSHPRCMSTVTERVMRERGDFRVFHEPFLAYHYLHLQADEMPMLDQDYEGPRTYESIRELLLSAAADEPVFFKDMSYFVVDRLLGDNEFCQRITPLFLIRDPKASIASYFELDPEVSCTEIGLDAQWQHYLHLKTVVKQEPLVINAEAIAADPVAVFARLWEQLGLEVIESALHWQADEMPKEWAYVQGWHGKVLASTGIHQPQQRPDSRFLQATAAAPHLHGYLEHHQPYYQKLLDVSMAQGWL